MAAIIAAGALLALAGFAPSAHASSIALFNTGVDAGGTPLSDGSAELHYTLNGGSLSAVTGTSAGGFPIGPWLGDDSASTWIGPAGAARFAGANGATFDYQTTFNLTGLNPATASISGQWSTDDEGVDILINGHSTGQTTPLSSYASFTSFIINSGFVNGINTLDFLVFNVDADCCGYPTGTNPTGLRVEMTGIASPTPLPAAVWLFGSVIAGGAGVGRWRNVRKSKRVAKRG